MLLEVAFQRRIFNVDNDDNKKKGATRIAVKLSTTISSISTKWFGLFEYWKMLLNPKHKKEVKVVTKFSVLDDGDTVCKMGKILETTHTLQNTLRINKN